MIEHRFQPLQNSFTDFGEYIRNQLITPIGQISFWTFLVLGIIGAGGYGVWVEIYRWKIGVTPNISGIVLAFYTYYPAVVGASICQLIFNEKKYVRSGFTLIGVVIFVITFFFFPAAGDESTFALVTGAILALISIIIWWIANGNEAFLHDHPARNASTGGDVGKELPGRVPNH